jgi:hypothetical protein
LIFSSEGGRASLIFSMGWWNVLRRSEIPSFLAAKILKISPRSQRYNADPIKIYLGLARLIES